MVKREHLLLAMLLLFASAGAAQTPSTWSGDQSEALDYRIGVEDVLNIMVWGEQELQTEVFVRPDGKVTFPLVNDIAVEGKTVEAVRQTIESKLSTFLRDPSVTVIVAEINSFRVFVLGEVVGQGMLSFKRPTRLLQAVALAGGFTDFSKKEIVVLRQVDGHEERIRINYKKVMSGETPEQNIFLEPGDTLLVD